MKNSRVTWYIAANSALLANSRVMLYPASCRRAVERCAADIYRSGVIVKVRVRCMMTAAFIHADVDLGPQGNATGRKCLI